MQEADVDDFQEEPISDEAGEPSIGVQMEHFIEDESSHRDETEKILKGKW